MPIVTSSEITHALVIYSIVHLVTSVLLNFLHGIKKYFYSQYQRELHDTIKSRPDKSDSLATTISSIIS